MIVKGFVPSTRRDDEEESIHCEKEFYCNRRNERARAAKRQDARDRRLSERVFRKPTGA